MHQAEADKEIIIDEKDNILTAKKHIKNHFLKYNLEGDFFMKNKILAIFIIFFIVMSYTLKINAINKENTLNIERLENGNTINIEEYENDNEDVDIEKILETVSEVEDLDIESKIALIYDRASGMILYEKNGNKQTPMASTTKIMTAIVVLENTNLKDEVTIDAKAAGIGGSVLGLKKNDKITVNDLLYGLMLCSGNDAAVALANYVGGSVEGFAEMMNKKAEELGLVNSHFVVPHGLDNDGHYTTAYELAKMADYALKIDKFKEIVGTQTTTIYINGYAKTITNTNKLLGSVSGVYGVKTGFTNGAGRCLVTACKREDLDIITVIIGADTSEIRSEDTIKLIQYAYTKFEVVDIKQIIEDKFKEWKNINQGRIYVNKGEENVELYLEKLPYTKMAVRKEEIDNINISVNAIYYFEAPIEKDIIIGNMKIIINDEVIDVLEIYNLYEIRKKEIKNYFIEFLDILSKLNIFILQ